MGHRPRLDGMGGSIVRHGQKHFLLTAAGSSKVAGGLFVVQVEGSIHDAMRELHDVAGQRTSHGRSCSCPSTDSHRGTVIRDGEVVR